ncbi:unnamed protein product [Brachionus calyciflorus]|uniref:MD-2-related lipid-recognition domain-containing protein n=1 Tax=Brachionus calyciflorus TaxID=104777 RepID=A0A813ZHH9_9BILA|nr:unnamed protein product [Brachionus calyciflorus]
MKIKIFIFVLILNCFIRNGECKYNLNKIFESYEKIFKKLESNEQINRPDSQLTNLQFSFSNCGPSNDPFRVKSLSLLPDPLKIPGNVTFSGDATFDTMVSSPIIMTLKIIKIVGPFKVEIPCIDNMGSCTYSDVCSMLPKPGDCPAFFKEHDIPCSCPFPAGEYSAKNVQIAVESSQKPPIGEYNIIANFQTNSTSHYEAVNILSSFILEKSQSKLEDFSGQQLGSFKRYYEDAYNLLKTAYCSEIKVNNLLHALSILFTKIDPSKIKNSSLELLDILLNKRPNVGGFGIPSNSIIEKLKVVRDSVSTLYVNVDSLNISSPLSTQQENNVDVNKIKTDENFKIIKNLTKRI